MIIIKTAPSYGFHKQWWKIIRYKITGPNFVEEKLFEQAQDLEYTYSMVSSPASECLVAMDLSRAAG